MAAISMMRFQPAREKGAQHLKAGSSEKLASGGVQGGVGIDLQVKLQQAAKALQDATWQVCIIALLEQLLHTSKRFKCQLGGSVLRTRLLTSTSVRHQRR